MTHTPKCLPLKHSRYTLLFIVLFLTLWAGFPPGLYSYRHVIKFNRILPDSDLARARVTCIIQDRTGFMWFGTAKGLYRYDGYEAKPFTHDPDNPASLRHNDVRALCLTRDGTLWVGTRGGLHRLNPSGRDFTYVPAGPVKEGEKPPKGREDIRALCEDRPGRLWIGTRGDGLKRLDPKNSSPSPVPVKDITGDIAVKITALFEDSEGFIWAGIYTEGALRLDPGGGGKRFRLPYHSPEFKGNANVITTFFEDSEGNLWAGTWGGLNRLVRDEDRFINYHKEVDTFPLYFLALISGITEDEKGNLWLGTGAINNPGRGVFITGKAYDRHTNFSHTDDPNSLSHPTVLSMYRDRAGSIWVGTLGGGVCFYTPRAHLFHHLNSKKYFPGPPNRRNIYALYLDGEDTLWMGTKEGLHAFQRPSETARSFYHEPGNPNSLPHNTVTAIAGDPRGDRLWAGTLKGLCRLDKKSGTCRRISLPSQLSSIPSGLFVTILMLENKHTLWIGTGIAGLLRMDTQTGASTRFLTPGPRFKTDRFRQVLYLHEDRSKRLWVGTVKGLLLFNPQRNDLNLVLDSTAYFKSAGKNPGHYFTGLQEDREGIFWLGGTGGELLRFNPENMESTESPVQPGSGDAINMLLGDERGNLWISSNSGLTRLNPKTGEVNMYSKADGLQDLEFNQGAAFKSPSGEMFFGGINGVNSFFPDRVRTDAQSPPVVFSGFKVFGKEQEFNRDQVRLSYRQNHFAFEFAALDYVQPGHNRYRYKMEGFDHRWLDAGTRRYAQYTNLPGGTYRFWVQGAAGGGTWNREGASIRVTITPPFWATWWFRISLLLVLTAVTFGLLHHRTSRFKTRIFEEQSTRIMLEKSAAELEAARTSAEFRRDEVLQLMTAISSPLIAVNTRGEVSQWNSAAEAFFNIPKKKALGAKLLVLLAPVLSPPCLEQVAAALEPQESPGPRVPGETCLRLLEVPVTAGSEQRLLSIQFNPISGPSGKHLGSLLFAEDITNRKTEDARKNLFLKLKTIGQLHAGLAHELNTPVQYLHINTRAVNDAVAELARLREDFAAHLEQCPMRADADPADTFPEQAGQRLGDIRQRLKKIAEVETNLSPHLPRLYCYPAELNQVFLNLLVNAGDAVEATGDKGGISIATAMEDNQVLITVADSGAGIPQKHRDRVFFPFFTTKEKGKGTGQGLSLARRIIEEKHNGTITFESEPGKGTTFIIRLPVEKIEGRRVGG